MAASEKSTVESPLFAWRRAITASALPSTSRLVALVMSTHMNDRGGSCYPSLATIAKEAALSEATVREHASAMVVAGWLERQDRPGQTSVFAAAIPDPSCETGVLPDRTPTVKREGSSSTPTVSPNPTPSAKGEGFDRTPPVKQESSQTAPLRFDTPDPSCETEGEGCGFTEPEDVLEDVREGVNENSAFERFWRSYPRRVGKPHATKAFARAVKTDTVAAILAGTERWAAHWHAAGTEQQFIPHPTTWLNRNGWNDDPPPVTRRSGTRTDRNRDAAHRVAAAITATTAGSSPLAAIGMGA